MMRPMSGRSRFEVRPGRRADLTTLTSLSLSSFVLGKAPDHPWLEPYVRATIAPYLEEPIVSDSAVAVRSDGTVAGYALVAVDPGIVSTLIRHEMIHHLRSVPEAIRLGGRQAACFYLDRVRDLRELLGAGPGATGAPHAHLNIIGGHRAGSVALELLAHIDVRMSLAGHDRWVGEVNAPVGRRRGALERLGFELVDCAPNRTLSRLAGDPVERLTLERRLPRPPQEGLPPDATSLAHA